MTTHRRAWMLRAGVVAVLAAGSLLAGPAVPALATDPNVQVTSLPTANLGPGQRVEMKFRVTNTNQAQGGQGTDSFDVTVKMPFAELRCEGDCNLTREINRAGGEDPNYSDFTVSLVAGTLGTNQTKNGNVVIEAKSGGDQGSASRQITVRGPEQAPMVKEISGKVTDSATGDGIEEALVGIRDGQDHTYFAKTDSDGRFVFTSSASKPIVPGEILITAEKEDFKVNPKRLTGSPGQSINTTLVMTSTKAAATPTATPEATAEALPSELPTETADAGGLEAQNPASEDSDSGGMFSWVLIVLGGLLVALGVGAIVLLLVRRKEDDGDEEGDDMPAHPRGPAPTPASRGMYRGAPGADPTRVVNRAGAGAAPTMVARPPMADAPTMMHRPATDPYADPYGAPPLAPQPQPPGHGAQHPGWAGAGPQTATQPPYGSPADAYGSPAAPGGGAYGTPTTPGAYGVPTAPGGPGAYGGPTAPGTYGSPDAPGAAYGSPKAPGAAYGSPAAPGGAYGAPPTPDAGYGPPPPSAAYGSPATRPGGESYGGRDYGAPTSAGYDGGRDYAAPTGQGYPAGGAGYPGGYDEPTGRHDGGPDYGQPARPYESGGHQQPASGAYGSSSGYPAAGGYPDGGQRDGYGQRGYDQAGAGGGYEQAGGGYDQAGGGGYDQAGAGGGYDQAGGGGGYDQAGAGGGYDQAGGGGGYDQAGGGGGYDQAGAGGGYDQAGGGYDARPGYDRVPEQRSGYESRGYDQGGYPDESSGSHSRHTAEKPPTRSERRSLDWLDD